MPVAEPLQTSRTLSARRGRAEPMVWLSAAAVILAIGALLLLLSVLAVRGFQNFWPQPLVLVDAGPEAPAVLGRVVQQSRAAAESRNTPDSDDQNLLIYRGGADVYQPSVLWVRERDIVQRSWPTTALMLERQAAAPLFGFLQEFEGATSQSLSTMPMDRQLQLLRSATDAARASGGDGRVLLRLASGESLSLRLSELRDFHAPNAMDTLSQTRYFLAKLWEFLSQAPRQVSAEGGVFPAIIGTVVLVVLMSILVTPLGVLAAVFLQEYAQRGVITSMVRVAVNNLAGVPSIVYGVFGLGFFVYGIGGSLDELFFSDSLPGPTLGTPGLLWAALTMALLTLPVVIVATEEGLARVPQSLREGSLALGATRAETLWRVVLPAASPALLTGLILAVARATGEVAPLILVGVAKYAPVLPVSGEFPYLHLDRQFMHLGFHIYDLGFQSPQLELTTGRVFSTALLLVSIVLLLNFAAVILRGRLREAFKAQDLL